MLSLTGTSGVLGGSLTKMNLDFSKDPYIQKVVIDSEFGIEIGSIAGIKISSVEISGVNVTIRDLCLFSSQTKLPKLNMVQIQDATIREFSQHQFCGQCEPSQNNRTIEVKLKTQVLENFHTLNVYNVYSNCLKLINISLFYRLLLRILPFTRINRIIRNNCFSTNIQE